MSFKSKLSTALAAACCTLALGVGAARADTLTFDFSITTDPALCHPLPCTAGTVTGRIIGLQDNMSNQMATAVGIFTEPAIFNYSFPSFGVDVSLATSNSFTVTAGSIDPSASTFEVIQNVAVNGAFLLDLGFTTPNVGRFTDTATLLTVQGPLTYTSLTSVPGPIVGAGLPGLILACGGLLALARRRRRQLVA